jgi:hypothetical protein
VTVANALSSKLGELACGDAGPNSQPVLNGTLVPAASERIGAATPETGSPEATWSLPVRAAARASGVSRAGNNPVASAAEPASAERRNPRRRTGNPSPSP